LPQNNFDTLQHAPKLFKETGKINWQQNVAAIHNLVRGLSPYPAAHTFYNGKNLKIFQTKVEIANPQEPVGAIISDNKTFLKVATVDGYLQLLELQLEGKKRMPIEEFLRGNSVENVVLG
jgi:methionyl-tRNA formyltransferase